MLSLALQRNILRVALICWVVFREQKGRESKRKGQRRRKE
jgi:hypothetical protein